MQFVLAPQSDTVDVDIKTVCTQQANKQWHQNKNLALIIEAQICMHAVSLGKQWDNADVDIKSVCKPQANKQLHKNKKLALIVEAQICMLVVSTG